MWRQPIRGQPYLCAGRSGMGRRLLLPHVSPVAAMVSSFVVSFGVNVRWVFFCLLVNMASGRVHLLHNITLRPPIASIAYTCYVHSFSLPLINCLILPPNQRILCRFTLAKLTVGLRVSKEVEDVGMVSFGQSSYSYLFCFRVRAAFESSDYPSRFFVQLGS